MFGPANQRKPVSAAGTVHLPPVTLGTRDNHRQVLILFQLSRDALQSVAYQSRDKEQRRKSCGRASPWFKVSHTTLVQWCFTPPLLSPCWWSPFPSANKSARCQPTRTCRIKLGFLYQRIKATACWSSFTSNTLEWVWTDLEDCAASERNVYLNNSVHWHNESKPVSVCFFS